MTFLSKKLLLFIIIILVETLAVLGSSSSPVLPSPEGKNESMVNITQMFEEWIVENGRVYSDSSEKARRFEIFKATIQRRRRPYRYYLPPSAFLSYNETESCVELLPMEMWPREEVQKRNNTMLGQIVYRLLKRERVLN
ncbi:hypothetical protein M0R45_019992 [Rubus argutus]|uniref:Cathepsin propeptide inhibitor domain-containing protein n=1 Tax=Rubus argutus TaxID=59490 RepID=A0AAW1X8R4_RUBAR